MRDAHSPPRRLPNAGYRKLLNEMELTRVWRPKSGTNHHQRIPSPFMGEG